ncbi:cadherin repeat domain-containing protein [Gimesia panareensis]|uniref:cadherin repeat domain-containing protein n=1 Tax=Gimesia panareensis TaxID=2527978 RepID=UPI00118A8258|nr:cadherin repeat domain-containing protein [Gimesia panareensis]QDU52789.1 Putative Ig domain protein [Gimesia panareensis]
MQKREKILAAIFGTVILVWLGMPVVNRTFIEPVTTRQNQLKVINQQIDQKEQKELELLRSAKQLGDWVAHSLPPDEHDAQRLYLEWLNDLAELSGITNLKLSPGRRIREGKTYIAIQVSLEGTATYDQLCRFLLHFYQTDLRQNIISMELDGTGTGKSDPLELKLTAEGLALTKAKPRELLFPRARLAATLNFDATSLKVNGTSEFPQETPFRIRINQEFLTVNEIKGDTWSLVRGASQTVPARYEAGTPVELAPLNQSTDGSTKLQQPLTQDAQTLKVLGDRYFPLGENFLIKIDHEILNVTSRNATEWTVQRGLLDTKAAPHVKGASVVQVPEYLQALYDYQMIADASPFAKPVPDKVYQLELRDIGKQTVVRGNTLDLSLPLSGINPSQAAPKVTVKSDLPGIVAQAGKLQWAPAKEQKVGRYPVTVSATQGDQTVEKSFEIEFLEKNTAPQLETVASVTAYQARPLSLQVKAKDADEPAQKLRFELESGAPEGMRINAETGELTWTPSVSAELKEYPVTVKVTDSGIPAASSSQKISVAVALDDAFFTFLTGSIELDGKRIAWIRNRATNQKREVKEGDAIDVADLHAVVKTITDKYVVLEIDGKPWMLSLGENFRSLRNLTSVPVLN